MKKRSSFLLLIGIALVSILGLAPQSHLDAKQLGNVTNPEQIYLPVTLGFSPPTIPETTKVLSETTTQYLSSVSEDGKIISFSQDTPELSAIEQGDVIASGVTDNTPYGFLRKVTGVSKAPSGEVVVNTEQAKLEEAIQDGTVRIEHTLQPGDIKSGRLANGTTMLSPNSLNSVEFSYKLEDVVIFDADGSSKTTWDQVLANGHINFSQSFELVIDVNWFEIEKLEFTNDVEESSELILTSSANLEIEEQKEIAHHVFSTYTVMVGPVPVVFTPVLTVYVGANGTLDYEITTSASQNASLRAGIGYSQGEWYPIDEFSNSFTYLPPQLTASLYAKAYAGPELLLKLYGAIGPKATVFGYLELEADIDATPWWTLYGGLEVFAGVKVDVLGVGLDEEMEVIDFRKILAQASVNNPPNEPGGSSPADNSTGQSINTNLSWSGGDPDGDTVTYDVYLEADDITPDVKVVDDHDQIIFDPGTLAENAHYYWRVMATDAHGETTSGPVWNFTTGSGGTPPGGMVSVPAGEFQMGCDPEHNDALLCFSDELPLHTVYLNAYQIDKHEVTSDAYAQFLNSRDSNGCSGFECVDLDSIDSHITLQGEQYSVESGYGDHPVIEVTWYGADRYCRENGKRLPTEAEWEKAARGTAIRVYPWGDGDPSCSLANSINEATGSYCVGDTTPVGSYPVGASPYGVLDMAGNVSEWVNDWYDGRYYYEAPTENPPGPESGSTKVARGGWWGSEKFYLRASVRDGWGYPSWTSHGVGFRCASAPGE